jgi:methionyl aminopeptidase
VLPLAFPRRIGYPARMTDYQTVTDATTPTRNGAIKLHGPEGFEGMRKAGRLAAEILDALVPLVTPGVTTGEIDDLVREMTLDGGAVPATLGYRGYAHSAAASRSTMSSATASLRTRR